MPAKASNPTPEQLWNKAAQYLESDETDGAQKCLLHWALLLDADSKKKWMDQLPSELFNAVNCIVQTAETILSNSNDTALAWISIGEVWLERDQPDWAHSCYKMATGIGPDIAMAHYKLGLSWHQSGNSSQALEAFQQASQLDPGNAGIWHNLGQCHQQTGRIEQSVEAYETALAIEPGHPLAGVALSSIHLSQWNIVGAETCLSQVIKYHPDNAPARHNRSQLLLLLGQYQQGWSDFACRFQTGTREHYPTKSLWSGEPVRDKKLLVHFEQGLGDTIMFSRFLPQMQALCGEMTFECQLTLVNLLKHSFPSLDIVAEGEAPDDFDVHLPLLSMGERLGLNESGLFGSRAYLSSPVRAALPASGKLRVGLTWAGNPNHDNDANRSIVWEQFANLTGLDDVDYFSLQLGPTADDCRGSNVISLDGQLDDCAATAAVIEKLDLVITVDTAVAHLAGALGKPTWVLLPIVPDWRWLLNRTDSPWYPNVTLYRQRAGEQGWQTTLERVRHDLAKRLA